jgi:hypothetical protein
MFFDKDLKLNHIYWAVITDSELGELCGKEIQVKFTGIAFRNTQYPATSNIQVLSDEQKEAVRKKLVNERAAGKRDAILMLSQIKIFREVFDHELNLRA